jgi:hypothetical protein
MSLANVAMTLADAERLLDLGVDPLLLAKRGFELAGQLRDELLEARLDTIAEAANKDAFVAQSRDVAISLARALELLEIAYHAGHADAKSGIDPARGYRAWEKQLRDSAPSEKKGPAKA